MLFSALSDAELVARCRVGDEGAWNELVERFSRYVYAICSRGFGLRDHDAEDVFQEVFARLYGGLHALRDDGAVKPYLAQLTRRLCIDHLREGAREQPLEEPSGSEQDERLERIDEALAVHEALARLPEHCREILDRFFARDESYRTIAEALDLPSGTIASRISRCLAQLRQRLEGRKPAPAESG